MNEFLSLITKNVPILYRRCIPITSMFFKRNTYVLKRKHRPILSKADSKYPRRLRPRHFIYDLVEDTTLREPENIHVILTTMVEGVGDVGDMISVMPDYARKHLLLPQKAVYATPENVSHYQKLKKDRPQKPEFSSIYAGMTLRFLTKKVVPLFMNSEEPWTLQPWHIRVAFRLEGIVVPEAAIKLPDTPVSGPDFTKEEKDLLIHVTINNTEVAPVRCRLFHIKKEFGILKLSEDYYLNRREAILKEQEESLQILPLPEIEDNSPEANISIKEKYRITLIK